MKEFYSLLYLQDGASEDEVRNAYKKLAKKFHPDKNEGSNDFIVEFRLIQDAYEKLIKHFEEEKSKYKFENNYTKGNNTETETPVSPNSSTVGFEDKIRFYFKKYKWLTGFSIIVCFLILKKVLMPEILNNAVKTESQNNANSQSRYSEWLKEEKPVINSDVSCEKSVIFGEIKICLPIIDGMIECYSNPNVKARAINSETEGNTGLAVYLNDETYKQISKNGNIVFDDYFKIFVIDITKDIKIGESELNEIAKGMEGMFVKENWDESNRKYKERWNYISVGKPIIIESYSLNNRIKTMVILTKTKTSQKETVMIGILNFIQIKERLVGLNYYKDYDGEESIKNAKSKNDYILLRLLDENK